MTIWPLLLLLKLVERRDAEMTTSDNRRARGGDEVRNRHVGSAVIRFRRRSRPRE